MRLRCLFSLFSFPERSAFGFIRSLFIRFCLRPEETNDTKSIKKRQKQDSSLTMRKSRKKKRKARLHLLLHHCFVIAATLLGIRLASVFLRSFSSLVGNGVRGLFFLLFWFLRQEVTLGWPLVDSSFLEELCSYCLLAFRSHSARRNTALIFTSSPNPLFFICLHIFVLLSFWIVF